ncbi:hypothetical protein B0H21DRAFT_22994 [Amylocystis lapponica]|nr:hypothetical protein B0H21DRAFT_22994 [Amylocystis lapponica]
MQAPLLVSLAVDAGSSSRSRSSDVICAARARTLRTLARPPVRILLIVLLPSVCTRRALALATASTDVLGRGAVQAGAHAAGVGPPTAPPDKTSQDPYADIHRPAASLLQSAKQWAQRSRSSRFPGALGAGCRFLIFCAVWSCPVDPSVSAAGVCLLRTGSQRALRT